MGWLLDLLMESIWEKCSQFIVDMMSLITDMFTELLSCDLSLFEELFSIVGALYSNAIMPLGMAVLLLICVWQLLKSMFGKAGIASEDPIELVCRSGICMFFIVAAKPFINYILTVAGTPYQWIAGTEIEVSSFSEYVSALEAVTSVLGIGSLNILILKLIMQFFVAWNYLKMLFVIAERYVLLGVFSYTAPLAFATGGAKATNNILASWSKMFGGQVVLIILNSWCLKMFLSGYGNLNASSYGFTKFFVATLCLVGFCKITFKLDSYMSSLGVNLGRTSTGMGAMGLIMAAGRVFSHVGKGSSQTTNTHGKNGESTGTETGTGTDSYMANPGMTGAAGPIPMGFGTENTQTEQGADLGSHMEEANAESEMQTGDFDALSDAEDGSVLEEMGMMPEGDVPESGEFTDAVDMDLESGGLSAFEGEDADSVLDESNMENTVGTGGDVIGEIGDYPVDSDGSSVGDIKESDMNLDGTLAGDGSVEDAGLGSGMDAFSKDGSISAGGNISGVHDSAGTQGILGEMGLEPGMNGTGFYGTDGTIDSGNVHISDGESDAFTGNPPEHGFSKAAVGDTQAFIKAGEEVNGLGYHDFDLPGQKYPSGNTGMNQQRTPAESDAGRPYRPENVSTGQQDVLRNASQGQHHAQEKTNINRPYTQENAGTGQKTASKNSGTNERYRPENSGTGGQHAQQNPDAGRSASSETKKQEYRKITEERKIREVPKSRKELKKKKKRNPKQENEDSQM